MTIRRRPPHTIIPLLERRTRTNNKYIHRHHIICVGIELIRSLDSHSVGRLNGGRLNQFNDRAKRQTKF